MAGIIERVASLANTEAAKAINLAHVTYQEGIQKHNHVGRALIEAAAEVCRNHPNLVGIGVGLLVEQLLVEEKRHHDAHLAAPTAAPTPAPVELAPAQPQAEAVEAEHAEPTPEVAGEPAPETLPAVEPPATTHPVETVSPASPLHIPYDRIKLSNLHPGKVAAEVLGALVVLKLGTVGARMFGRHDQPDVWFAPAAKIHAFSAAIAAYYLISAARSPKISAWRNAAITLFATDALKPLLKPGHHDKVRIRPTPGTAPTV